MKRKQLALIVVLVLLVGCQQAPMIAEYEGSFIQIDYVDLIIEATPDQTPAPKTPRPMWSSTAQTATARPVTGMPKMKIQTTPTPARTQAKTKTPKPSEIPDHLIPHYDQAEKATPSPSYIAPSQSTPYLPYQYTNPPAPWTQEPSKYSFTPRPTSTPFSFSTTPLPYISAGGWTPLPTYSPEPVKPPTDYSVLPEWAVPTSNPAREAQDAFYQNKQAQLRTVDSLKDTAYQQLTAYSAKYLDYSARGMGQSSYGIYYQKCSDAYRAAYDAAAGVRSQVASASTQAELDALATLINTLRVDVSTIPM